MNVPKTVYCRPIRFFQKKTVARLPNSRLFLKKKLDSRFLAGFRSDKTLDSALK